MLGAFTMTASLTGSLTSLGKRRNKMRFYVRGRGEFPFDMLRYDACYPADPDDSGKLYGDWQTEERTVCVRTIQRGFTPERWLSFGWSANHDNVWE
jgi:hypothetical protein